MQPKWQLLSLFRKSAMTQKTYKKIVFDAEGKKLGRLATEVAVHLMGKDLPEFARNTIPERIVEVINVSKLDITDKKKKEKEYKRYSGYPGGLKSRTMEEVIEKKGYGEVFEKAVYGMLPGNKLRPRMMKNLVIKE